MPRGKRRHPNSAADDNPRPSRRMSMTPDPNRMEEDAPTPTHSPPPSSPEESGEQAGGHNASSPPNQASISQQLPFNPSPSPGPGHPTSGSSGPTNTGLNVPPSINVAPAGGGASSHAAGPSNQPPPPVPHAFPPPPVPPVVPPPPAPPPAPPLGQHLNPVHQAPVYLNPVPAGGFPPIIYRIETLTESLSDTQRQELRALGDHSAVVFLAEDTASNDPELRRTTVRECLDVGGFANVVPRQFGLVPGRTHRRGHPDRRSGALFVLDGLSTQQDILIRQRSCFSTSRGTIFILPLPLENHTAVGVLVGIVAEVREFSTRRLTAQVTETLRHDEEVLAFIRDHNDRLDPRRTFQQHADAVLNSVRVVGLPNPANPTSGLGQWSLRIESPTNDPDLVTQWMSILQSRVFETDFGNGSAFDPLHCTICFSAMHTSSYCPFPHLPGWQGQVRLRRPQQSSSYRGSRGRGGDRGGRGGRGAGPGRGRGPSGSRGLGRGGRGGYGGGFGGGSDYGYAF
ncbi:hypothetical protein DFP72DRAFT_1062720 [Ephemerocybe angulata]|uniref:Uncharacterized protein n=1 Tax=Ephemerocybe angulata TaxID=980116 RepID=A0A8H6I9F8_9AGAR|nr:hypothetical protein DFP72DRAFT_1062720 [Tulosesus angulatus]